MNDLSRRSILGSMAILPAVALPAIPAQADHPDAALLALDGQLDRLIQEWHYVNDTDLGADSDQIVGAFNHRQHALISKIISTPARTAEGLAVQTKAMSLDEIDLWDDGDDDHPFLLRYLNSACATLGVVPATRVCRATPTLPMVCADPIFAAIVEHRRSWQEMEDNVSAADAAHDYEEVKRLTENEVDARSSVLTTVPTTREGLCAYVAYLLEWAEAEHFQIFTNASKDGEPMLRSLVAATQTLARA